ncbi:hypothetical protein [Jatrophihabitans lederbergiae]|uniref:Uncharacterized protein n=1 Tax=Jatrophihabitans lederbergiae TaxID=3075547 RepID=A0ABU2JCS6_9ACTN|nr:hypothetical protein [Jatrophihabitans sp. DSM 44399]MDT0262797.1 hypothetical protein [Jatrophihabitans sp. DSM 44399]
MPDRRPAARYRHAEFGRVRRLGPTETIRQHLAELVDATVPATLPGPHPAPATTKAQ